jgi:hypothetical protein
MTKRGRRERFSPAASFHPEVQEKIPENEEDRHGRAVVFFQTAPGFRARTETKPGDKERYMQRFIIGTTIGLIGLAAWCATVTACDTVRVIPPFRPPVVTNTDDTDLDALLEKRKKAAARRRLAIRAAPPRSSQPADEEEDTRRPIRASAGRSRDTRPSTVRTGSTGSTGSANDRVLRAALAQQALAAQTALFRAKRAELERWDRAAQEKFAKAFGTTDEAVRERVLQRLDALIDRNIKAMAAIADNINFQAYLESRKGE